MSTGGTVALVVGGAVVVGGVAYLITRTPANAGSPLRAVPKQQAAAVGTAAAAIGSGLGGLLTTLFGSSKSAPTTSTLQGVSQLPQPAPQSWGGTAPGYSPSQQLAVSNALADDTAASDSASGVVGFGGWDD